MADMHIYISRNFVADMHIYISRNFVADMHIFAGTLWPICIYLLELCGRCIDQPELCG